MKSKTKVAAKKAIDKTIEEIEENIEKYRERIKEANNKIKEIYNSIGSEIFNYAEITEDENIDHPPFFSRFNHHPFTMNYNKTFKVSLKVNNEFKEKIEECKRLKKYINEYESNITSYNVCIVKIKNI